MTQALQIVRPLTITDSILSSSNVPEDDYAQWNQAVAYAIGDRVILTSTHKVYESLTAANTGNDPTTATHWIEVGPTNRWAAFDSSNSTQTAQANSIAYSLALTQAIDCVALLNVTGAFSAQIVMTDPVLGEVYSSTESFLSVPLESEWHEWFFGTRQQTTQWIATDLPLYSSATLDISITGGESLAVGVILLGKSSSFGLGVRYGARLSIQDYSRKETNEFGDTTLVRRAFAKRADFDLLMVKREVNTLFSELTELRAVPALWIGSSEYEATAIFGFYKNFEILISYPEHSECSLEIEGLT